MKKALNNQVGMLGDMFLWLVANLKQGVIHFIKQACGNDILASVYNLEYSFLFFCSKTTQVDSTSLTLFPLGKDTFYHCDGMKCDKA